MTLPSCPSRRTVRRRRAMPPTPKKKAVRKTPSHPKDSKWYATKVAQRTRKPLTALVDDSTRALVEAEAKKQGRPLSHIVEQAILEYVARQK